MEDWIKERVEEIPSSERPTKPPFTIFGWDLYIVAFLAIAGGVILLGIYWIFFSGWPMPIYCGGGRTSGSHICGWMARSGREAPAPWAARPSSLHSPAQGGGDRTLDHHDPPS